MNVNGIKKHKQQKQRFLCQTLAQIYTQNTHTHKLNTKEQNTQKNIKRRKKPKNRKYKQKRKLHALKLLEAKHNWSVSNNNNNNNTKRNE